MPLTIIQIDLDLQKRPDMSICVNYIEKVKMYKHFEGNNRGERINVILF